MVLRGRGLDGRGSLLCEIAVLVVLMVHGLRDLQIDDFSFLVLHFGCVCSERVGRSCSVCIGV